MELCAQPSPVDNTSRGLAAHVAMFPSGHRSVPAYLCPQLMPTCCLCQLLSVPCTRWPWAQLLSGVLPARSHSAPPAPAALPRPELGFRGYPSCSVLGSLPTCTGVEHQGRAMTAVGASPCSEPPWHIWRAASWLCHACCWLHIPCQSLLTPLLSTVLLAEPSGRAGPHLGSLCPSHLWPGHAGLHWGQAGSMVGVGGSQTPPDSAADWDLQQAWWHW